MSFRVNAKNFFLTYPQCSQSKEYLLEFLLGLEPSPIYALVSAELHEDGSPHLHSFISYQKKRDIRSQTYFDLAGNHPNIQAARDAANTIRYIKKDGDFIESGIPPITTKRSWSECLTAETKEQFFDLVKQISPRDFVLQHDKLSAYANHKYARSDTYSPEFPTSSFCVPTNLQHWFDTEFKGGHSRRKSLILSSPSRFGKTEWARSLGPHMYFNNMCNFRDDWDDSALFIIFDDIPWEYLPNKKGFLGGQKSFVLTSKYMKMKTVSWGKICIYLCNAIPDFGSEHDWIIANCDIISLTNKLY